MAWPKLNSRSITMFVATPDEVKAHRPDLHSTYFRVKAADLAKVMGMNPGGDIMLTLSFYKNEGRDGKTPFFKGSIEYPDTAEKMLELVKKDDKWIADHPMEKSQYRPKAEWAAKKRAEEAAAKYDESAKDPDIEGDAEDLPF